MKITEKMPTRGSDTTPLRAAAKCIAANSPSGVFSILAVLALVCSFSLPKIQAAQNILTDQLNNPGFITLRGNTRPEATAKNDRGRVPDDMTLPHMLLQLHRTPEQERALEQFIEGLHDPASPLFHHWITAEDFGRTYGAASGDISRVTEWLQSQGFIINQVYPNQMVIDFSGSAGQIRQAFHTEIHQLHVNGKDHIANVSDPQIPAALASTVEGIVSLNDFRPHPMFHPKPNYTYPTTNGNYYALVPADLWTIYNFGPAFAAGHSGQGQTIVVIEDTDLYSSNDWNNFRSTLGLTAYSAGSLTTVHPGCSDPGFNSDDVEATVDAEWATAAAPSATIEVASCPSSQTNFGGFVAMQNLLNSSGTPPAIMSISYGQAESVLGAAFNASIKSLYQQAVTEGVSVFVSSGDSGGAATDQGNAYAMYGINVSGFASTPYNVSVGGTDFADTYQKTNSSYWSSSNATIFGSAKSYIPEIPWNDSCGSVLVADYAGMLRGITFAATTSFCNGYSNYGFSGFLNTAAGAGGPSGCATGAADLPGAVSGTCAGYPKPSWQSGFIGNARDGVRDIPDVALFAGDGLWSHYYVLCFTDPSSQGRPCTSTPDTWSGGGGTSVAAPIMAGIQALINQASSSRWGNPNPAYYALSKAQYGSGGNSSCYSSLGNAVGSTCIFHDVVQIPVLYTSIETTGGTTGGDSDVPCAGMNCYSFSSYGVLSTYPQLINQVMVTKLGSGYTGSLNCTLSGGGGSGATCSGGATGVVRGVNLTAGGSGYSFTSTTPVSCAITGGGGSGAECVVYQLDASTGAVVGLALTSYGSGYTSNPTCTIGGGLGATCTATKGPGIYVTINDDGGGYTSLPRCVISGGGGTGATCAALAIGSSTDYAAAFTAGTGWDFTTGIGTVNASNLVKAFTASTAMASLSATTLTFSSQALQTTSTAQNLTVTNGGTTNLIIVSDMISGTNASDFAKSADTCAGAAVAPSGKCTVSVTFTPSALGTRSASLIFTDIAPHSPQTVNLTGTGASAVAVTLSPSSASVALGAKQVFTAAVTGATSTAVKWYVNGVLNGSSTQGTLAACTTAAPWKCTYTAPTGGVPSPNPAVIKVVSVADLLATKTANVTVTDSIAVTLSPTSKSLTLGGKQVFTATITGTTDAALKWYVNGALNGNSTQGTLTACTTSSPWTCTYTAPSHNIPSPNPAVIAVASAADPSKTKTASVTVTDSIAVTLTPTSKSLSFSGAQVFTATVSGTTDTVLNWYVNGVLNGNASQGTLAACTTVAPLTCKYTAPSQSVPSPNPAVIKVVSAADTSKFQTAAVTVTDSIVLTITPTSASLAPGGTHRFIATISNTTDTAVSWYVNGVLNGNSAQGTLSVTGLTCIYTAPKAAAPSPNPAIIKVASQADPSKFKTASVEVAP